MSRQSPPTPNSNPASRPSLTMTPTKLSQLGAGSDRASFEPTACKSSTPKAVKGPARPRIHRGRQAPAINCWEEIEVTHSRYLICTAAQSHRRPPAERLARHLQPRRSLPRLYVESISRITRFTVVHHGPTPHLRACVPATTYAFQDRVQRVRAAMNLVRLFCSAQLRRRRFVRTTPG